MLSRAFRTVVLVLGVCGALPAADPSSIWLDIPFVRQEKDGCGAASIAMVMQYWEQHQGRSGGPDSEAARIQRSLHPNAARRMYASEMESYFRRNGYRVFAFRGEWPDLQHHLQQGRPLIVAIKPGSALPFHYVVVAGVDQEHRLVLLNDPAQRKLLKQERSRFEQQWNAAGGWTLLALPQGQ